VFGNPREYGAEFDGAHDPACRSGLFIIRTELLQEAGREPWSDSKCYESIERNVNPTDTLTYVDPDKNLEIRYGSPNTKTKSFAVVLQDGLSFRLDSEGNAEAAQLVPENRQKIPLCRRRNWRDQQKHGQGGLDFNGPIVGPRGPDQRYAPNTAKGPTFPLIGLLGAPVSRLNRFLIA
jgi:hypothetical protein